MKTWFAIPLWQRVIGALILGIIVGRLWGPDAESIKIIGDIFIAAIKMLVVPLIFFSLVAGVAAIGDLAVERVADAVQLTGFFFTEHGTKVSPVLSIFKNHQIV